MAFIAATFLFASYADAGLPARAHCPPSVDESDETFIVHVTCQGSEIKEKRYVFRKTGSAYKTQEFENGRIARMRLSSSDGESRGFFRFAHHDDGSFTESFFSDDGTLERRTRKTGIAGEIFDNVTLSEWRIEKGRAIEINHFTSGIDFATTREILDENERVRMKIVFRYSNPKSKYDSRHLIAVSFFDSAGRSLGEFKRGFVEHESLIASLAVSASERERILNEYRRAKEPVLIIDSGFEVSHPLLVARIWRNPGETLDGKDNDGNGWIDDVQGWNIKSQDADLSDILYLPQKGEPISHGSHVASIALKDTKRFALMGLAGNMTSPVLLSKAVREIERHRVRFANLSFGWESEDPSGAVSPFTPGSDSTAALEEMILKAKSTLFVTAASNEGKELSSTGFCTYPACFNHPNMLKVGALSAADFSRAASALPTDFSNFGREFVDIFAPGEDVMGATIGGRMIPLSGTSMASPMTLNTLLSMSEIAPELSPLVLKEILLKTAFVPSKPLPAKSGGMVFPARAREAVRMLKAEPALGIEEACAKARTKITAANENLAFAR